MQLQDKNVVRTAADLEKKYNFAQLLGLKSNVEATGQALIKVENELNNMLNSLVINLSDVLDTQSSISLWFYEGIPTTNNEPYTDWITPADHYGDFYYDQNSGYVYKYTTLGWELQSDTNLINAMALTNVELDVTLDHERQVFFEQPTPPYQSGDWWVLEDGTLMICQLGKPAGEVYEKDDFIVSSRYVTTVAVKQNDTIEVLKGQVVMITDTYVSYTDKATGKTTAISGDSITTGNIKSANYIANTSGTKISLTDGTIDTKNFKVDNTGNITATGGKIAEYTISGAKLVGTNVGLSGLSGDGYAFWAGSNTPGSAPYRVGHDGSLYSTSLNAQGGQIASFTIDNNAIYNGIGIGDAGSTGMSANLTGWAFWAGNGVFRAQHDGYVYASNIDAVAGHIGSFTLDQNFLYSGSGTGRAGMSIFGSGMAFYAGAENSNLAPFRVDHYGNLTASAADITGKITANSGTIGGWSIANNKLRGLTGQYGIYGAIRPYGVQLENSSGTVLVSAGWGDVINAATSDKRVKNTINEIDNKYEELFDDLKPVTFYFNKEFGDDKKHIGFIAQDIIESEEKINEDLAMVKEDALSKKYNLNKQEIIALNTWQIQKLKKQVQSQQEQIEYLMNEIKSLKEKNI